MKKAVICFTRVPKPGVTKTRLLPILSGQQCAELHTAFLKDLAQVYDRTEGDLFVAHTADPHWEMLKGIFPMAKGFFPQEGADLGEKMYNAIREVLSLGYDACVLTGADLPLMTPSHLESGFAAMEVADLTIGPTSDGGYYLIGMKKPHWEVFQVSGYGGASVYENTVTAAQKAGLTIRTALTCDDVDTPEDLRDLAQKLSADSATRQFLNQLKEEGILL